MDADQTYWDAIETLDADLLASRFAARATFQLANLKPVIGPAAIRRAFLNLFLDLDSVERRAVSCWQRKGLFVCDADLDLNFTDGTRLTIAPTTSLWIIGGQIQTCRVAIDLEPRLARYFAPADFCFANSALNSFSLRAMYAR
ncbi:MAG TPA: hypothetical protein VG456_06270 [Candidatus Sulfopaludibacter sp.]|jgi:hypothetical protein|nr:hypothetical protein [Candidatus Sulfopaludibacter sp.]